MVHKKLFEIECRQKPRKYNRKVIGKYTTKLLGITIVGSLCSDLQINETNDQWYDQW